MATILTKSQKRNKRRTNSKKKYFLLKIGSLECECICTASFLGLHPSSYKILFNEAIRKLNQGLFNQSELEILKEKVENWIEAAHNG